MEAANDGSGAEAEAVVSMSGIREASVRIGPYVHLTPVMRNQYIDETSGREVFFKCELFQKTGSFKARGACNAVLLTPPGCRDIITHSSGNHAQVGALFRLLLPPLICAGCSLINRCTDAARLRLRVGALEQDTV